MDFLDHIQTKERSANFTKDEMDRLQKIITKHKNIIFCKKTDAVSSKQKESAWNLIDAVGNTPRTIKQLKYKFENLKRVAEKEASKERQEMRRTGGGPPPPPPPPPKSGDDTDWLRSMLSTSIDGNEAIYDDDVISQDIVFPARITEKDIIIEDFNIISNEECQLKKIPTHKTISTEAKETSVSNNNEFDASTPYSSLKRPISSPLRRQTKKHKMVENENVVRQLLREKKMTIMDNLQELELERIRESIKHAQELHKQTLRHNEERHEKEIEKLNLEIELLKKNLV